MGSRGPKPKPLALRLLDGNAGRKPLNFDEPDPKGKLTCPRTLSGEARRFWKRVVPQLVTTRVAKATDRDALEVLARLWAAWKSAAARAEKDPVDAETRRAMLGYAAEWARMAGRFGLSPSDRTRIVAGPEKRNQADPVARYLG